jgi:hypothetical protein
MNLNGNCKQTNERRQEMDAKKIKLAVFLMVALAALAGGAGTACSAAGEGVGRMLITAGEAHVAPLLLISSGLLFMVRCKTRRN